MELQVKHAYWVIEGRLAGRPGPMKFEWDAGELAAAGVGGVVSFEGPIDAFALSQAGVKHVAAYQPMVLLETRAAQFEFLSLLPRVFEFADEVHEQGGATLIHCFHGRDRSGAALACYLAARENLTAGEAIDRVRSANPEAMVAYGYAEAVFTFESLYRRNPSLFEAPT